MVAIAAPILQIDLAVRNIDVAAQDDLATAGDETAQMREKFTKEAILCLLPMRAGRARREVRRDDRHVFELCLHVAPLGVELGGAEATANFTRPAH